MTASVLVGDVGGTSVRLGMAHRDGGRIRIEQFSKRANDGFDSFETAIASYLAETGERPTKALFALAGPVANGEVHLINRPSWPTVSGHALKKAFGLQDATLVNDFAAMARAIPELPAESFEQIIRRDVLPRQPKLVAGPGTGFGVATLIPRDNGGWRVISGEGGHATFAAYTRREFEIVTLLQSRYGHVSNELICSGMGLEAVHRAICDLNGVEFAPMRPRDVLRAADEGDAIALEICQMRGRGIMGVVSDLALVNGCTGGVVIAGGVSQRLAKYLRQKPAIDDSSTVGSAPTICMPFRSAY